MDVTINQNRLISFVILLMLLSCYAGYKFRSVEEGWISERPRCNETTFGRKAMKCLGLYNNTPSAPYSPTMELDKTGFNRNP